VTLARIIRDLKSSLLVRLLAPYLIALAAVAVSLYAYSDAVVERFYLATMADGVLREAHLVGALLPWDERGPVLDRRCSALAAEVGARISVIAADGTVIGDSDAASETLENHRERFEVRSALSDGEGQAVRVSTSVHRDLFYRAWRQSRGDEVRIIRLAVGMTTIEAAHHRIRMGIWIGFVIAALAALWPAVLLARRLSERVARLAAFSHAVAAGTVPPPLLPEGDDVITRLETDLPAMATSLRTQLHAVHQEKGKLETVLSSMVEGVLVTDRRGTIRLANQRVADIFGVAASAGLIGQPLINISRDPDLHALVRGVTRGDCARPLVDEITLERGSRETLRVTATAIAESTGMSDQFIFVFHDISELKKLEVTRRDFVANVSHELRTPLTAIRGYAETLQSGAVNNPELAAKFLGVIERHSERLGRLIDDLLTLSDLELGRTELQRTPMQLAPAVDAAIDVLHEKALRGQVEIRCDLAADLPALYADPDRVEQVLVNLIDNAVKYTPPGGRVTVGARVGHPNVRVTQEDGAVPVGWVEIDVADTGAGVPRSDLPRLTERFYRVDKARSRELGGTGLGLAIVKHIVQAHGGTLRIDSELGKGTRVCIYWPVATPGAG
jgi:two-component system, OmpR family, phosphate regulon sensor histidine kinase PhoR